MLECIMELDELANELKSEVGGERYMKLREIADRIRTEVSELNDRMLEWRSRALDSEEKLKDSVVNGGEARDWYECYNDLVNGGELINDSLMRENAILKVRIKQLEEDGDGIFPRFVDGEMLEFGDFVDDPDCTAEIETVVMSRDGYVLVDANGGLSRTFGYDDRLRGAKMVDADGRQIARGDAVYDDSGTMWLVTGFDDRLVTLTNGSGKAVERMAPNILRHVERNLYVG